MFSVDTDDYIWGTGYFFYNVSDIGSDTFLNLKTARYGVGNACHFRKADDPAAGDIAYGDMHMVHERQMMLFCKNGSCCLQGRWGRTKISHYMKGAIL